MTKYSVIIRLIMSIASWYDTASKDEIITMEEIADLIHVLAKVVHYEIKL